MINKKEFLINDNKTIQYALEKLNVLGKNIILFIIDDKGKLVGSLTDGDVRRGLLKNFQLNNLVTCIMNVNFKYSKSIFINDLEFYRSSGISIIPIINDDFKILEILNINELSYNLPLDVLIMAGGEGKRLRPLTNDIPKPLLKVGDKAIISHNIDRLEKFGVKNIFISLNYLANKIENYFTENHKQLNIQYIKENIPLGTIGSLSKVTKSNNEYILVTNSDILTDLDYSDLFKSFIDSNADILIATIPYNVSVPYAILEVEKDNVLSLKEKPTYNYYANAGIYILKYSLAKLIPENSFFNATDLIEKAILLNYKVTSYSILGYWLDIGSHTDFQNAQNDIIHLKM